MYSAWKEVPRDILAWTLAYVVDVNNIYIPEAYPAEVQNLVLQEVRMHRTHDGREVEGVLGLDIARQVGRAIGIERVDDMSIDLWNFTLAKITKRVERMVKTKPELN